MGIVICFGTMMSILLIVLIMPVSYWQIFRNAKPDGDSPELSSSGSDMASLSCRQGQSICVILPLLLLLMAGASPAVAQERVTLTLEDCRSMAAQNNAAVVNSRLDVYAAKAQKEEALAEYFPKVSVNAFAFYAIDPLLKIGVKDILGNSDMANNITSWVNQNAPMYGINPYYSTLKRGYSATVSVVQPVFAGGRIVFGNRLAALGVEAASLQNSIQSRKSAEEIEQMYWQVVSLEEKMKTISQVRKLLENLEKDLSSAVEAGLATQTDMLQLKLKMNELRSAMTSARGGIRLAKMNLCNSIGMEYAAYRTSAADSLPYIDSIAVADNLPMLDEPMAYWRDENEIVARREESRLLELAVEAKKAERRMVLGEVLPQVGVGASYGYGDVIGNGSFNGVVFATIKIPVTDWGKYSRRLQRYDYQVQKACNDREYLGNQLLLEIRKLWFDLTVAWEQTLLAEENVAVADAMAEDRMNQYKA
ncbi:MAG: TolC family protein, partial [Bacteroidales bacterium]|nr:TolC family protein [Bacteroidales bacterium]